MSGFIHGECLWRPDFRDVWKAVGDVLAFVKDRVPVYRWELGYVEDAEIQGWRELVLTIYVDASPDVILDVWDELYEYVDVDKFVVMMLPTTNGYRGYEVHW